MKTELIPKLALTFAFASMLAVTTTTTQANICSSGPEPKPDVWFSCWDCPYQCHGDADCRAETVLGYRVYTTDLAMFQALWKSAHEWPSWEALAAFADRWCDCGNPYDPACGY